MEKNTQNVYIISKYLKKELISHSSYSRDDNLPKSKSYTSLFVFVIRYFGEYKQPMIDGASEPTPLTLFEVSF